METKTHFVENCAVLDYYIDSSGNFFLPFQDSLLVPSSEVKNQDGTDRFFPKCWQEITYLLRNNPEEHSSDLLRGRSLKSHTLFVFYVKVFLHVNSSSLGVKIGLGVGYGHSW
jgi:hypothetical protein